MADFKNNGQIDLMRKPTADW